MTTKKTYNYAGMLMPSVASELRDVKLNGWKINGIRTGFPKLDNMLDGLRKATLTVVGARPKQGKTAFAVSVIRNVARRGTEVYFASLEMPSAEIIKRLIAIEAGVNYEELVRGQYTDEEGERVEQAIDAISAWPLMIDEGRMPVPSLWNQAKYAVENERAKLVIVDYMQYILPSNGTSRYEAVTGISMALAEMRKALNVPIFSLAQLSRKTADRSGEVDFSKFNPVASRPRDSDLRESGQIEQDADSLIFLNRPETYVEDMRPFDKSKEIDWLACMQKYSCKAEVIVHFNRSGRKGIIDFYFDKRKMLFEEMTNA